jgi:single-stranded-DNA-specific exonuclease
MVPLVGANRVIAKRGLELLAGTERVGLQALKAVAGVQRDVNCTHVGFGLGPRLNAAGRMVHGELVIELLTTNDSDRAGKLARKLNKLNTDRQETEARIKELAIKQVEAKSGMPSGLVIWNSDFHTGVIGLVAQRLAELYYRPVVVIGSDHGRFKGSVRGIAGFNVVEALSALSAYLERFGGHEGAGGLSIAEEKIPDFVEAFDAECRRRLDGLELEPYAVADTEAGLEDITPRLLDELRSFAPFGVGNPSPTLLIRGLQVTELRVLKNEHIKVVLSDSRRNIAGLMWRERRHPALEPGAKVDVACRPDKNLYGGHYQLQLNLQAVERAQS